MTTARMSRPGVLVIIALSLVAASLAAGLTACSDSGEGPERADTAAAAAPVDVGPCPDLPRAEPVAGGLPDLELPCLGDGPAVRLSDLQGVPTVVNVWAAWCVNCDREMPLLADAKERAGDRVRFFGIHYKARRDRGLQSQADFGVPFPSVHDGDGDLVARALRATAPPQTLFVAPDGTVAGRKVGEIKTQQEFDGLVKEYLGVAL